VQDFSYASHRTQTTFRLTENNSSTEVITELPNAARMRLDDLEKPERKTGKTTTLNEQAHRLSALISEIVFLISLPFKAGHRPSGSLRMSRKAATCPTYETASAEI
jgi:hypothetical protein